MGSFAALSDQLSTDTGEVLCVAIDQGDQIVYIGGYWLVSDDIAVSTPNNVLSYNGVSWSQLGQFYSTAENFLMPFYADLFVIPSGGRLFGVTDYSSTALDQWGNSLDGFVVYDDNSRDWIAIAPTPGPFPGDFAGIFPSPLVSFFPLVEKTLASFFY